jgi:hypothetical protein
MYHHTLNVYAAAISYLSRPLMHLAINSLRLFGYPAFPGIVAMLSVTYKQVIGIRMSDLGQC